MKKTLLLIIPFLFLFVGCEDSTEKVDIVKYSSINDGDNVPQSSGLIIQFSEEVELETFEADTIIHSIDWLINGVVGEYSLPIIEIKSSNYITLNDEPQTFFYDSLNYTCALVRITTHLLPDGTGEGFNIEAGNNEFKIGDNYSINFTSVNPDLEGINAVPNPLYSFGQTLSRIDFVNLPSVCEISIYTITGERINKIEHDALYGNEDWDLKNENGEDIDYGIYRYEIISELNTFTNGVFILEK